MRPDELRGLRQDANEMQGQEVGLVYDLLEPQQLILVIIWRLNDPEHLLDHGAGQVAGRGQLQSTGIGCSSKQDQGIGRDRRSGDFRIGEVGFEADRVVTSRGLVTKSVQAVEFEHVQAGSTPFSHRRTSGFSRNPGATIPRLIPGSEFAVYLIGSVPHRLRSRPPSAIAITTRISAGRGASATETVMVSKCGNDQESCLCPSGTSRTEPAAAT